MNENDANLLNSLFEQQTKELRQIIPNDLFEEIFDIRFIF